MRTIRPTVKIYATKKYCEIHGKDNGCAFMDPTNPFYDHSPVYDCMLFRGDDECPIQLKSDWRGTLRCQECIDSEVK